jgi:hypothetical protein
MIIGLSRDQILSLPASVPLVQAGEALGFGRTKAHELAKQDRFPIPVLRLGGKYRCRRSDLLAYLGIEEPEGASR